MATDKTFRGNVYSPDLSYLTCDICDSTEIIETFSGFVCKSCGVEFLVQKLQYDRPYNADIIQIHKGLGATKIGTQRERLISPISMKLNRLNRQNLTQNNEKTVSEKTRIEISRIFTNLDLADYVDIKEMVFKKCKEVRRKFRSGSKYRNIGKLVSVVSYLCLKLRNISINPNELIEVSGIAKKVFNDFILQVRQYLLEYSNRNRQAYIVQKISEISNHFDLGMPFCKFSKKILFRLWESIKGTTDNVVAGLVTSIAALCSVECHVSVSAICKQLDIQMSTIQSNVKRKIFDKCKKKGFVSLVKSAGLLNEIMIRLGLKGQGDGVRQQDVNVFSSVEIILGNATEIFSKDIDLSYFFAMNGEGDSLILTTLNLNEPSMNFGLKSRAEIGSNVLLNFEPYEYFNVKDPPMIKTYVMKIQIEIKIKLLKSQLNLVSDKIGQIFC